MLYEDGYLDDDIQRQAAYCRKEFKVHEYAIEFWKEIVPYYKYQIKKTISDDILPLYCFNRMGEIIASVEEDNDIVINGSMVHHDKQAVIRIGIDGYDDELDEKLKRTIRHEIIHYLLWLVGHNHEDDSLEFWCFCHMFDANSYQELSFEDEMKSEQFADIYDELLKDEWLAVNQILVPQLISELINGNKEYEELVMYIKGYRDKMRKTFDIQMD